MAELKPVIDSVTEAICANCIYSKQEEEKPTWFSCTHTDVDTHVRESHFCQLGYWLVLQQSCIAGIAAYTLEEVFESIMNREENYNEILDEKYGALEKEEEDEL